MPTAAGYAAEMQRIDEDIAELDAVDLSGRIDPERVTRQVYRLYQRASIAGDLPGLSAVEAAIDRGIPLLVNPGDLYLLKVHTTFKLHKLADARAALFAVPSVYDSEEGRLVCADVDFQCGRYQAAESGDRQVLASDRSWDTLARLAHLRGKMGDALAADRLFEEAEDQLTAKELRSFAWLEVQ